MYKLRTLIRILSFVIIFPTFLACPAHAGISDFFEGWSKLLFGYEHAETALSKVVKLADGDTSDIDILYQAYQNTSNMALQGATQAGEGAMSIPGTSYSLSTFNSLSDVFYDMAKSNAIDMLKAVFLTILNDTTPILNIDPVYGNDSVYETTQNGIIDTYSYDMTFSLETTYYNALTIGSSSIGNASLVAGASSVNAYTVIAKNDTDNTVTIRAIGVCTQTPITISGSSGFCILLN